MVEAFPLAERAMLLHQGEWGRGLIEVMDQTRQQISTDWVSRKFEYFWGLLRHPSLSPGSFTSNYLDVLRNIPEKKTENKRKCDY
jgi:hypothetical protein